MVWTQRAQILKRNQDLSTRWKFKITKKNNRYKSQPKLLNSRVARQLRSAKLLWSSVYNAKEHAEGGHIPCERSCFCLLNTFYPPSVTTLPTKKASKSPPVHASKWNHLSFWRFPCNPRPAAGVFRALESVPEGVSENGGVQGSVRRGVPGALWAPGTPRRTLPWTPPFSETPSGTLSRARKTPASRSGGLQRFPQFYSIFRFKLGHCPLKM